MFQPTKQFFFWDRSDGPIFVTEIHFSSQPPPGKNNCIPSGGASGENAGHVRGFSAVAVWAKVKQPKKSHGKMS